MASGSGFEKSSNTELSKEMNAKLAELMAQRNKQDNDLNKTALSEKEYEAKYGKQPSSTEKEGK